MYLSPDSHVQSVIVDSELNISYHGKEELQKSSLYTTNIPIPLYPPASDELITEPPVLPSFLNSSKEKNKSLYEEPKISLDPNQGKR